MNRTGPRFDGRHPARILALFLALMAAGFMAQSPARAAESGASVDGSFEKLDEQAKAGRRLNVAFLGGSLTWGANATDPQRTSYRALVGQWLTDRYPKSQIICHDASIGGTGSRLGIFRLDRDVLAHKPDLLFLDFTANDNIRNGDAESFATYEAIVRRTILEARCPVVMVILPFKADMDADEKLFKRLAGHLEIAKAYGCAVGNAVELMRTMYADKQLKLEEIWDNPKDGAHPGDAGYVLFTKAATSGFEKAVQEKRVSHAPEAPLNADTFLFTRRERLSTLSLPEGWAKGTPSRIAGYFDMQPSRWMDDMTVASVGAKPIEIKFRGSFIGVFGEGLPDSGAFRATIDGKPLDKPFPTNTLAVKAGAAVRFYQPLASNLSLDTEHVLVIEPTLEAAQTLRLESVTLAGKGCGVVR